MTSRSTFLAPHVQAFFTQHLCQHKQASPQTIASYRDTFRLFLTFVKDTTGREPVALQLSDLDAPIVLQFLDSLEHQRGNTVRSRNMRLAAIRTFMRFLVLRAPESLAIATRVLAIPVKRTDKKLIEALTRAEVEALLAAPNRSCWIGRRDHALLLTLYNSGARVSEVTTLQRHQVCFGTPTFLQLTGKGRKERTVPLWPQTSLASRTSSSGRSTRPLRYARASAPRRSRRMSSGIRPPCTCSRRGSILRSLPCGWATRAWRPPMAIWKSTSHTKSRRCTNSLPSKGLWPALPPPIPCWPS